MRYLGQGIVGSQQCSTSNFQPETRSTSKAVIDKDLWRHEVWPSLETVRLQDCTDPRDKVYSAYAITLDSSDPAFKPSYSSSVKEVYCEVVSNFIAKTGSLDILASCTPVSKDLPTWTPDWRKRKETMSFADLYDPRGRSIYGSSGISIPQYSMNIGEGLLNVAGISIDTLKDCSKEPLDLSTRR